MTTKRDSLIKTGLTGTVLEIYVFYFVAVYDLEFVSNTMATLNTLTESVNQNDMRRVRQILGEIPENDEPMKLIINDNIIMSNSENVNDDDVDYAMSFIEHVNCGFKRIGYSRLLEIIKKKKMMLNNRIMKLILSLRDTISFCDWNDQDTEEFKTNIPRGLQVLVLKNTKNVCITNSKYKENLIMDKYKYRGSYRRAFTWVPKTEKPADDVDKWELDFEADEYKMQIKNKKFGEYLTTPNQLPGEDGARAFGTVRSDGFDWEIELSENWNEIYLKNMLSNKYIYVTKNIKNSNFCGKRRYVRTTESRVKALDGGRWEFIDCGMVVSDENDIIDEPMAQ